MTYQDALKYIHLLERFGIQPGLERVCFLCAALGNPQEKLQCVHVAGTNGKGSTCAMLAEIMRAAGYKTGLYTSPYVVDFRERMQINGRMIPEEDVARWTERLREALVGTMYEATEFEFITAMAFAWFAERDCDIVILETGLGGRYDATNIIRKPLCSVITKIAMDHMRILGNTIEAIAHEKCGIIKPGCPVVTACEQPMEALEVIRRTAQECDCAFILPDESECKILETSIEGSRAILANLPVNIPLIGLHMARNALTAVRVSQVLGIRPEAILEGIGRVKMPARMEVLSQNPLILLDGGHNPDGARALTATLTSLFPGQRFQIICGMMADKNIPEFIQALRPVAGEWITCRPDNPRAMPSTELAVLIAAFGQKATAAASVKEALRLAEHSDSILICGSFYLAGEIRPLLTSPGPTGPPLHN